MSDESRLQVTPGSSLILSSARSSLVARGLLDATALAGTKDPWSENRRLAEAGDARAQYELGNLYAERYKSAPWGFVRADYEEATKWYRKAAEQGLADAAGKYSYTAFKFYPDEEWLLRAVAAEMSNMGLSAPKDLDEALSRWRKTAEVGNAQAQFNLGNMYASGQGVSRNYTEAANWYQKAAEQGHTHAQLFLGWLINSGDKFEGGEPSPVQRAYWPQIAYWLGEASDQGLGPVWMFFENASDAGFTYYLPGVARWEWDEIRDCDERGHNEAVSLGCMDYECGLYAEAERHFRQAADQGDATAQFYLGCLFTNGRHSRNDAEAVNWYRKAADQGHADGQFWLGHMYQFGSGVPQDYAEAAKWYRKAAELGHPDAQFCLGSLFAHGYGILQNPAEAARWHRKAADQGHYAAQVTLDRMRHQANG